MGTVSLTTWTLAEVHFAHFGFQALGHDVAACQQALKDAWEIHCRDYPDADMDHMREAIEDGDVNFSTIAVGGVLRDGETLL